MNNAPLAAAALLLPGAEPTLRAQSPTTRAPVGSLAPELEALHDMAAHQAYREGTSVLQTSSYDGTYLNDDGFSERLSDVTPAPLNHTLTLGLKGEGTRKQFWFNRIILVRRREGNGR